MPSIRLAKPQATIYIVFVQPHNQDAYIDSAWTRYDIAKVIARDIAELRLKFPLDELERDEDNIEYFCDENAGYWHSDAGEGVWIVALKANADRHLDRPWRIRKQWSRTWFNTDPPESGAQHPCPSTS